MLCNREAVAKLNPVVHKNLVKKTYNQQVSTDKNLGGGDVISDV